MSELTSSDLPLSPVREIQPMMVASKSRKPGCESCREKHVKCDGKSPCSPCVKKNLQCRRPLRVRLVGVENQQLNPASPHREQKQRWTRRLRHHHKVQFIDQSSEVARSYDEYGMDDEHLGSNNSCSSLVNTHRTLQQSPDFAPIDASLVPWASAPAVESPSHQIANNHNGENNSQELRGPIPPSFEKPERRRAQLIRHFLEELGPAFDPWDESRRFTSNLVEEALGCPMLMQSILLLVEILFNETPSMDQCSLDALLMAAAVNDLSHNTVQSVAISLILRAIEIVQGNTMNVANIGLIPKLSDLADWSHEVGAIPRSLEYELFWSGLWLEVYVATMYQKPFASLLHTDHIRQLIRDEQDERCWTNKMLLHLVDIIDYCFSGERSRRAYNKLQNDINSWQMSKPASFDPVSMISTEDGLFPPIWLLNDTVIAGLQYFHLARLLLLAHDPSMPLVGAALKKMNHERDTRIRTEVKTICGIANSVNSVHPAHLTASVAISLVGDRFTDEAEQKSLLECLRRTEIQFGWSTTVAQSHLKEAWHVKHA